MTSAPTVVRRPRLKGSALSLVPGPLELPEPFWSTDLDHQEQYAIDRVVSLFDGLMAQVSPRGPDPFLWRWRYTS